MKGHRQGGYIFRKGNIWYLRYREDVVQEDGSLKYLQRCRWLVEYGGEYRSSELYALSPTSSSHHLTMAQSLRGAR